MWMVLVYGFLDRDCMLLITHLFCIISRGHQVWGCCTQPRPFHISVLWWWLKIGQVLTVCPGKNWKDPVTFKIVAWHHTMPGTGMTFQGLKLGTYSVASPVWRWCLSMSVDILPLLGKFQLQELQVSHISDPISQCWALDLPYSTNLYHMSHSPHHNNPDRSRGRFSFPSFCLCPLPLCCCFSSHPSFLPPYNVSLGFRGCITACHYIPTWFQVHIDAMQGMSLLQYMLYGVLTPVYWELGISSLPSQVSLKLGFETTGNIRITLLMAHLEMTQQSPTLWTDTSLRWTLTHWLWISLFQSRIQYVMLFTVPVRSSGFVVFCLLSSAGACLSDFRRSNVGNSRNWTWYSVLNGRLISLVAAGTSAFDSKTTLSAESIGDSWCGRFFQPNCLWYSETKFCLTGLGISSACPAL